MSKQSESNQTNSPEGPGENTKAWSPGSEYFKKTFSRPEAAVDFLSIHLPASLQAHLDLQSLELSPDTYVTDWLTEIRADVVYSLKSREGEELNVCFLIEHKADSPEQEQPLYLQLLKYMVHAWDQQWKAGHRTLRPIIPVVVYTGAKGWVPKTPERLFGLNTADAVLLRYIPQVSFILESLRGHTEQEISALYRQGDLFMLFKLMYAKIKDQLQEDHLLAIWEEAQERVGDEASIYMNAYVYLGWVYGNRNPQAYRSFLNRVKTLKNQAMENAMSIYVKEEFADKFAEQEQRITQQVTRQVTQQRTRATVVNALRKGNFSLEDIADIAEVSVDEVLAVKEAEGL